MFELPVFELLSWQTSNRFAGLKLNATQLEVLSQMYEHFRLLLANGAEDVVPLTITPLCVPPEKV